MKRLTVVLFLSVLLLTGCGAATTGDDGLHSTVPSVQGLSLEQARDEILDAGYRLGSVTRQQGTGRDPGTVLNQDPVAGTSLARESDVNVTVAE